MVANNDETPVPLLGSARSAARGAGTGTPIDPATLIEATVVLRPRADGELGADPADVEAVTAALTGAGLKVLRADAPSRRIRVQGAVHLLAATFGTELTRVESIGPDGRTVSHRQRIGELTVPPALANRVIAVLGLDDRPQARSQLRIAKTADTTETAETAETAETTAAATSYAPVQLGAAYDFPAGTDGTGQSIAVIELGGGFAQPDLDTYFAGLGIAGPSVTAVGVDGASNQPGADPQGADGEVLLDIEVSGALAPGALMSVYFAPNTDAGFLDAVSEAIHASPTPAAVSISWGQREGQWTAQARAAMDSAFADAVRLGVVVTVAAGDNGSADGAGDGSAHCDFPAASPNVLACGGTSLQAGRETVWNDGASGGATGGGVSGTFARPARQATVGVPSTGRGVPDVAGNADPRTGYQVLVDGTASVIGGTSAVAPLWAALIARLAQAQGGLLLGFLDAIYAGAAAGTSPSGFRDITSGDNGSYRAAPGWDACTGLGSPDGTALLARLAQRRRTAQA